jgi:hypothetical protein
LLNVREPARGAIGTGTNNRLHETNVTRPFARLVKFFHDSLKLLNIGLRLKQGYPLGKLRSHGIAPFA